MAAGLAGVPCSLGATVAVDAELRLHATDPVSQRFLEWPVVRIPG